jgi:hypothetical protein
MHHPKIQSAVAFDDHTLLVEFDNSERKIYDITPLLSREMFSPLKSPVFFRSVTVEKGGYAVAWGADIDISEYELWTHGQSLPRPAHQGTI